MPLQFHEISIESSKIVEINREKAERSWNLISSSELISTHCLGITTENLPLAVRSMMACRFNSKRQN
jgi:hypothetical protein